MLAHKLGNGWVRSHTPFRGNPDNRRYLDAGNMFILKPISTPHPYKEGIFVDDAFLLVFVL